MLSITELKKGTIFVQNNQPYKVIEYAQKQMGRGGSIVNVRIKNLMDGSVREQTFKGSDKLEEADVTNKKVQFLYGDNELNFMDQESYDQFAIDREVVGLPADFLKEGQECVAQYFSGNVINVEVPIKVELKVKQADPAVKGDTVSNVTKNCTVETGKNLQVPMFIKSGDVIIVDTRDGSYVERKK